MRERRGGGGSVGKGEEGQELRPGTEVDVGGGGGGWEVEEL